MLHSNKQQNKLQCLKCIKITISIQYVYRLLIFHHNKKIQTTDRTLSK